MDSTSENSSNEDGSKKSPFDDLDREELIKKCKGLLTIAQKAKQAKSELQSEVENHKKQLTKCETEKQASQDTVQTLQELVNTLTEQKLSYITELDAAQNKVKTLTNKCENQDKEVAKCNTTIAKKEEKIAEVLLQLSNIDSEIISLKRQNHRLAEENEQLIGQLTEMEARTEEVNKIGLQQREQLRTLEEQVLAGATSAKGEEILQELNNKIKELEFELQSKASANVEQQNQITNYESKVKEVTQLYESEKDKKENANIKLRSYKDKILKCASCINQLKNTRFILSKTVKEYSESIPKWQNDIIKASKFLDTQLNELNNENNALKVKLQQLEKRIHEFTTPQNDKEAEDNEIRTAHLNAEKQLLQDQLLETQEKVKDLVRRNEELNNEVSDLKQKYEDLRNSQLPTLLNENKSLKDQLNGLTQQISEVTATNRELNKSMQDVEKKNKKLNDSLQALKHKTQRDENSETVKNLNLQIRALESEKATLVKEKMTAKESLVEIDSQNKTLSAQVIKLQSDLETINAQFAALTQQKEKLESDIATGSHSEISNLKKEKQALQECYDLLKKEHENLNDLNGLLKDEVDTLKMSLEQPNDGAEHLSDLNVSLQADIVKLETKLSAYKQENSSLLAEVKESRVKIKEVESIRADYEDTKTKLVSYKTENTELLNEMKEINQVLKERGEAISKLQKAIAEMERLIETLEKDRDDSKKEKEELAKKVNALEHDLKNAQKESSSNNAEVEHQLATMRTNAFKLAAEKEAIITSLKEEVEKLKESQQHSAAELPNDDNMSTSTISKADDHSRMKDLDESFEDKYSKLRIFALKLKKKLNETNIQLHSTEQDKLRLEKMLGSNKPATQDVVDGPEKTQDKENKTDVLELEEKVKSLSDALKASKNNTSDIDATKAELAAKIEQLNAEVEAHKATKESLEKARRDVKKRSVLSLEMEDYERSMKELTTKMEENKKKFIQMESTIDTQEGTITAMKTQIKLLEEQIKIEETQNRLVREELHHAIEEGKEKDNVVQLKNGIISKLEQDLEEEKRKSEEASVEMTALLGDKEKRIVTLGEEKIELNNKLKKVEFKCADLEEKLRITNIELEDLKTDYTSYKVRAQSVLRQNQTVDHSQEEQLKEEAAALKAQIDSVTLKLNSTQEKCTELQAAAELERRRASEATAEAARATQRTTRLQADLSRLAAQLDSERGQHKLQVSTLTQCYKTQITELETKLQKDTEELKKQLAVATQEKTHPISTGLDRANRNDQYLVSVIPKEDSDGEMDVNVSMLTREEGEGSESAPSPPLSKSFLSGGASGRSPVPLERLLEEGVPEDEALDVGSLALSPEQELAEMRRKMQAQLQRVKHVTVLLSESERECARYAQMNELLKAEVRRARGSLERTEHAHNAEYMKNVTLKFVTLPPGDERSRLVPVLQKILTLTSEETQKINAVARGADPNPGKGWGSYLPWPGGK